jgi:ligand-binding SRPBCC domain-containing protein
MTIQIKGANRENRGSITIVRSPTGHGFQLKASQFLPYPQDQVFEFFADAFKLQTLTPTWLHFSVVTPPPIRLAAGTLIDYRLRVHRVALRWQSRISVWDPPWRFFDEQMHGPYRRWHHQHVFESTEGGTLCRDTVDYEVYGGSLINTLFVRPDLFKIFAFRQSRLRELFPDAHAASLKLAVQVNRRS